MSDQSNPVKTATSNCIFDIVRDQQPPVFIRTPYQVNILENRQVGERIYTVTATDGDLRGSIVYGVSADFLTGDYLAAFYFSVDSDSGQVRVRNTLRTDSTTASIFEVKIELDLYLIFSVCYIPLSVYHFLS